MASAEDAVKRHLKELSREGYLHAGTIADDISKKTGYTPKEILDAFEKISREKSNGFSLSGFEGFERELYFFERKTK